MRYRDLALGVMVMAVWGFNFIVIKIGVDQLDPLLLTALRFAAAALPAVFFVRRPPVAWRYIFAYGLVFGTGVWGMVTFSVSAGLSPGMASLLLQMNVAISMLIGWLWLNEQLSGQKLVGAALALCGLLLSLLIEDGTVTATGLGLVLLGAICWSLSGLIMKAARTDQVFSFIVWGLLFAPLPLLLLAYLQQGAAVFSPLSNGLSSDTVLSILFQAWPTTLLGYWLWNRLIVTYPLSTVAPLTLLVPVFGLLSSWLVYQEPMGDLKITSAALIIAGLVVGTLKIKVLMGWLKRYVQPSS